MTNRNYRALFGKVLDFMGSCDGSEYDRMVSAADNAGAMQGQIQSLRRENSVLLWAISQAMRNSDRAGSLNVICAELARLFDDMAAGGGAEATRHYRERASYFRAVATMDASSRIGMNARETRETNGYATP